MRRGAARKAEVSRCKDRIPGFLGSTGEQAQGAWRHARKIHTCKGRALMCNTEEFKPEVRSGDADIQEAEAGGSKFRTRLSSSVNSYFKIKKEKRAGAWLRARTLESSRKRQKTWLRGRVPV